MDKYNGDADNGKCWSSMAIVIANKIIFTHANEDGDVIAFLIKWGWAVKC